jgi:hypothetical protein
MNLVGKIFVVLIFVFSLVFMSFAIAVYATHRNWRDVVLDPQTGLKQKLTQAETRYKELEQVRTRLETALANEKASAARAVAALEEEKNQLEARKDALEKQEAKLRQDTAVANAAMDAMQSTLAKLREEIESVRADISVARAERDENFTRRLSSRTNWPRPGVVSICSASKTQCLWKTPASTGWPCRTPAFRSNVAARRAWTA